LRSRSANRCWNGALCRSSLHPIARALAAAIAFCAAPAALAQGEVDVLCSVPIAWCEAVATAFQNETGIAVHLTQKGSAESLAQVVAEKGKPRHDVWYAGTGDAHLQAATLGLTEPYRSPMLRELHDWAMHEAERSKWHAVGIYTGALGIGYNTELIAKKRLPEPKCWADLARPEYRDEVQIADPRTSTATYSMIATFVQIFGEDKAFDLLRAMRPNTSGYPRTGAGAIRAVARGDAAIGVTFLHDGVTEIANGFPVKLVVPCEGTGYEVGAMSIVKDAPNRTNAQRFYDWALTPAAQRIGSDMKNFQTPSNKATPIPPVAPKMSEIKLIQYDFAKYGTVTERARLLEKWDREVRALPR
jgi:iron(III) transport system substrate-binding protein